MKKVISLIAVIIMLILIFTWKGNDEIAVDAIVRVQDLLAFAWIDT